MNTTVLQIPINVDLRKRVDQMAENQGFSSVQEVVRVFLSRFATGKVGVEFFPSVELSSRNEARYSRMMRSKTNQKEFDNVDDLLDDLSR